MTLIVIIFFSRWERWGTRVLRILPEVRAATYRVSQELYVGAVCFRDKTMAKTEATEASVVMVSASSWNVSSRVVSSCSLYLKLPVKNIRSYHKCCCKFALLFIALVITVKGMDILTHSSIWILEVESYTTAQTGIDLTLQVQAGLRFIVNLLPQLPKCWDHMYEPSCSEILLDPYSLICPLLKT